MNARMKRGRDTFHCLVLEGGYPGPIWSVPDLNVKSAVQLIQAGPQHLPSVTPDASTLIESGACIDQESRLGHAFAAARTSRRIRWMYRTSPTSIKLQ